MRMQKHLAGYILTTGLAILGLADNPASANPNGPSVQAGAASFTQPNAQTLEITNSAGAIINWQGFSIGAGETTRFVQPNAASSVLNRVTGGDPSSILGRLESNGRVFLINPSGIVFGPNSSVDVAGLVASSLSISNADFLAGRLSLHAEGGEGAVINQGWIKAGPQGEVVLIAPRVENSGLIEAPDGQLLLAAGERVTLNSLDDAAISFEVEAPTGEVLNLGRLIAERGAAALFARTVRHSGEIRVGGLERDAAGRIRIVASEAIELGANAQTTADGGTGGRIDIDAGTGRSLIAGQVSAQGTEQTGGRIVITGSDVELAATADIDASGATGGGEVLIGGDWQGKNPKVRNAEQTRFAAGASARANAKDTGDGGKVVVWADGQTDFKGRVEAEGGREGGNGGQVEVSGKRELALGGTVSVAAPRGRGGMALFDPFDFVINTPEAFTVQAFINSGAGSGVFSADNDIIFNVPVNASPTGPGGSPVFLAGRSILLNADFTVNGGDVTVSFLANATDATINPANRGPGPANIVFGPSVNFSNTSGGSPNGQLVVGIAAGDASRPQGLIQLGSNTTAGDLIIDSGPLNLVGGNNIVVNTLFVAPNAKLNILGGLVNAISDFTVQGALNMSGGNINGGGNISTFGEFIWSGGTISTPASLITLGYTRIDGTSFLAADWDNHGDVDIALNGAQTLNIPATSNDVRNFGTFRFVGNASAAIQGLGRFENYDRIFFQNNTGLNLSLVNFGRVGLFNGVNVLVDDFDNDGGGLFIDGTLHAAGNLINRSDSDLLAAPNARIVGNVFNNGFIEIGTRLKLNAAGEVVDTEQGTGTLFIDGDLNLGPESFVVFDLGGGKPGCTGPGCYDQLVVAGTANLNGGLVLLPFPTAVDVDSLPDPFADGADTAAALESLANVNLITPFRAFVGDSFDLVRFANSTGDFEQAYPVGLPGYDGIGSALATRYRITVTQAPLLGGTTDTDNNLLNAILPKQGSGPERNELTRGFNPPRREERLIEQKAKSEQESGPESLAETDTESETSTDGSAEEETKESEEASEESDSEAKETRKLECN